MTSQVLNWNGCVFHSEVKKTPAEHARSRARACGSHMGVRGHPGAHMAPPLDGRRPATLTELYGAAAADGAWRDGLLPLLLRAGPDDGDPAPAAPAAQRWVVVDGAVDDWAAALQPALEAPGVLPSHSLPYSPPPTPWGNCQGPGPA